MKILKLTETTSTNDVLLAHPIPPPKEMVVAVAEYQTAGRGQAGNSWESERGKNLLFSIKITFILCIIHISLYHLSA